LAEGFCGAGLARKDVAIRSTDSVNRVQILMDVSCDSRE